jgi:hypothetical protein
MRSDVEEKYCGDKFLLLLLLLFLFPQADVLAFYSKVKIKTSCCIYYSVKE